jgi:hypothetical protein
MIYVEWFLTYEGTELIKCLIYLKRLKGVKIMTETINIEEVLLEI